MHTCLKCGRIAQSVGELEEGCLCGSKVFVFKRDLCQHKIISSGENANEIGSCQNSSCTPICSHGEKESAPAIQKDGIQSKLTPLIENENKETISHPASGASSALPPSKSSPPSGVASSILSDEAEEEEEIRREYSEVWLSKGAIIESSQSGSGKTNLEINAGEKSNGADGLENEGEKPSENKISPSSVEEGGAPFEIENIRQLKQGVFEVDIMGVDAGPLVVKDPEGVYYVRLPFANTTLKEKK